MSDAPPPLLRNGVLLTLAYDGRRFAGLARQPGQRTVAGALEDAIRVIDPEASRVRAVSRTDAGVHAYGQRVSFATQRDISSRGWVLAVSEHLPDDLAIVHASHVPPEYDPRRHALWKRYRYLIHHSNVNDPFLAGRAWRLYYQLDLERMRQAAELLIGRHDFAAFRGAADTRESTVRTLTDVRIAVTRAKIGSSTIEVSVTGDRFLYNMVRIIVGTLVDVGRGHLAHGAVQAGLSTGRRELLGMTAPPDGLYLEHIELDVGGSDGWPH